MSYENAPATKMLATHCAVCRRPLVDATSVETGMGPECRSKHGFNVEIPEEARVEANAIVHAIACEALPARLPAQLARLGELGLTKLAGVIAKRCAAVQVEVAPSGDVFLRFKFDEAVNDDCWRTGRARWDKEAKARRFSGPEAKRCAWAVIKRHFGGCLGLGPDGAFRVPAEPGYLELMRGLPEARS